MILSTRRTFLRGLFATPAIIAIDRLMPVRALLVVPEAPTIEATTYWYASYALGYSVSLEQINANLYEHLAQVDLAQMPVRTLRTPVDLRERLA